MAEGGTNRQQPVSGAIFPYELRVQKKKRIRLVWEKEKPRSPFRGNPTITLLVNLSAFRPRFAGGGWAWVMRFCLG
jgi:hypothetical protein